MRTGVITDHVEVGPVEPETAGATGKNVAMTMSGQIRGSEDYLQVRYVFDADCVAALITELIAFAQQENFGAELNELIEKRIAQMEAQGQLRR
jgi:hypothetical protein